MAETAFAASRGLFEQVATDLTSPDAAALTHSGLEGLLAARMREVTRQLFQDHLDLRAVRERRAGRVVDAAGVERTRIERGRTRSSATVFGKVAATRIAYRATGSADLHLADAAPTHARRDTQPWAGRARRHRVRPRILRRGGRPRQHADRRRDRHRQVQELAVAAAADTTLSTRPWCPSRAPTPRCWCCPPTARAW